MYYNHLLCCAPSPLIINELRRIVGFCLAILLTLIGPENRWGRMARSNPIYVGDRRIYLDSNLNFTGPTARENEAELLAESNPFKGKPRVEVLNVTAGWDTIAQFELLVRRMQQLNLYHGDLLYCGTDAKLVQKLGVEG